MTAFYILIGSLLLGAVGSFFATKRTVEEQQAFNRRSTDIQPLNTRSEEQARDDDEQAEYLTKIRNARQSI